jgi:hypothetical protein
MNARLTLSIKLPSIRKVKNHSLLREEEDMTINKRDSEVKKNLSLRKRLKLLKRLLLNLNVVNANKRDSYVLEEPNLSNLMRKRKHNNKNLRFIFLNIFSFGY